MVAFKMRFTDSYSPRLVIADVDPNVFAGFLDRGNSRSRRRHRRSSSWFYVKVSPSMTLLIVDIVSSILQFQSLSSTPLSADNSANTNVKKIPSDSLTYISSSWRDNIVRPPTLWCPFPWRMTPLFPRSTSIHRAVSVLMKKLRTFKVNLHSCTRIQIYQATTGLHYSTL